jgi:hypothetical protein
VGLFMLSNAPPLGLSHSQTSGGIYVLSLVIFMPFIIP